MSSPIKRVFTRASSNIKGRVPHPTTLGISPERDEIQRFSMEQKENNVGIPHSLRFMKRK
ncbi:hypothetical protein Goklo_006918 [Gossypium klotzschianum]|uniref:Uncharacterized protein n=1 Tax=Gossypium klotzschianum TaxID=34286 RepID=A0A7J8VJT9_9ROSI|nr:hypothetical protein [Gossypium klotzschianum]